MLQNSFQSFLATAEKPHFGLRVTVFAGLTNMVLDFLLVYVFPFGLLGAALATAFSQIVGALIPLVYFLRPNDSPLRLTRPRFDFRALAQAPATTARARWSATFRPLSSAYSITCSLMAIAQGKRRECLRCSDVRELHLHGVFLRLFHRRHTRRRLSLRRAEPRRAQEPPQKEPDRHASSRALSMTASCHPAGKPHRTSFSSATTRSCAT